MHPDTLALRLDGWGKIDLQDHQFAYAMVKKNSRPMQTIAGKENESLGAIVKISPSEIMPLDSVGKIILWL